MPKHSICYLKLPTFYLLLTRGEVAFVNCFRLISRRQVLLMWWMLARAWCVRAFVFSLNAEPMRSLLRMQRNFHFEFMRRNMLDARLKRCCSCENVAVLLLGQSCEWPITSALRKLYIWWNSLLLLQQLTPTSFFLHLCTMQYSL